MKFADLSVRAAAIPVTYRLRRNAGVHPGGILRTIPELISTRGIVGPGEVGGGDRLAALTKRKPRIVGRDRTRMESIKPASVDLDLEDWTTTSAKMTSAAAAARDFTRMPNLLTGIRSREEFNQTSINE